MNLDKLPREFRGCCFDDGWEYDAPCVVYYPRKFRAFGIWGNADYIYNMIEDIISNISLDKKPKDDGLLRECKWRGWSLDGFRKRKNARHIRIVGHWIEAQEGLEFIIDRKEERDGPF